MGKRTPISCLAFTSARSKAGSHVTGQTPFPWQSPPQDEHLPQRLVLRNDGWWRVQSRSFPRACPSGSAHHFARPSCWKSLVSLVVGCRWGAPAAPLPSRLLCVLWTLQGGGPSKTRQEGLRCPACLTSPLLVTPLNPGLLAQPPPACGTNYVLIPEEVSET